MHVAGHVVLTDLDMEHRQAIGGVLGRSLVQRKVRIDLVELDRTLRASAARAGLVEVVEHVCGTLIDKRSIRELAKDRRTTLATIFEESIRAAGLANATWPVTWMGELSSSGVLTRLGEAAAMHVRLAVSCFAELLGPMRRVPTARGVLAQRVAGTAHALDDGTVLARIVLKGIAHAAGAAAPNSAADRRALWRSVGVSPDEVSTTVLTSGLRPSGNHWADLLRMRSEHGAESHLSGRDLARISWKLPAGTIVSFCENPRVVEAAMDAGVAAPLVCTLGNPNLVVADLVGKLLQAGARVRYHGDFDWAGIAIAGRIIALGCLPWRMSAYDYEQAVVAAAPAVGDLPILVGPPVPTPWEPELGTAMTRLKRIVQEEALLDLLVKDLKEVQLVNGAA